MNALSKKKQIGRLKSVRMTLQKRIESGIYQPGQNVQNEALNSLICQNVEFLREPYIPPADHFYPVTDVGFHEFEITLLCDADEEAIRKEVYRQTAPVRISESTYGVNREIQ